VKARRVTLCFAILGVASCSGEAAQEPTRRESLPIINGEPDTGDPAVVFVEFLVGGVAQTGATGSLVSPHVVLTAGHATTGQSAAQVFFGQTDTGPAVQAKAVYTDPMYPGHTDQTIGHDQGVIVLAQAGPATPVPMNRTTLTMSMAGKPVRIVGFGRSQVNGPFGTKLQGTDTWDKFTDGMIHFGPGPQHECEGDSGGPALQMIDGCEVIIGTVSFHVDSACMDGWYSRLDDQLDFVDQYIHMYDPGYSPPCSGDGGAAAPAGGGSGGAASSGNDGGGTSSDGGSSGNSESPTGWGDQGNRGGGCAFAVIGDASDRTSLLLEGLFGGALVVGTLKRRRHSKPDGDPDPREAAVHRK